LGRFSYQAISETGRRISGAVDATDRRQAVTDLAARGRFVTQLMEQTDTGPALPQDTSALTISLWLKTRLARISGKDLLAITTQLAAALRAGLPLLTALQVVQDQQDNPAVRKLLSQLASSVSSGEALSDAMAKRSDVFEPLYVSMIKVGETGGILDQTMSQLVQLLDRDEKIKTDMRNAAAYPLFVLCIGILSAIIVITTILPRILATITGGLPALPWPTRVLLTLASFTKNYGLLVLLVLVGCSYYLKKHIATPAGRLRWDRFKLKIPVLGPVLRTIAVGRFTRTFGALTKAGITILQALAVVRDTLGNEVLAVQIDEVATQVKAGESLAGPLAQSGQFPGLLVQIVSVGEQTGKLDELLLNTAETFDADADAAIKRFMAIFPAVLILLLALVVGFIIAATLLPIVVMELGAVTL
jgi:type II secretory pathway component PulF